MTLLHPDWAVPTNVHAVVSTRAGGGSTGGYSGCNLGTHVGDDFAQVLANRKAFLDAAHLPCNPMWLTQVHGIKVVRLDAHSPQNLEADACWTDQSGIVCTVLTADCLPVLLASKDGTVVAAAHAGWRGLVDGVLEATIAALPKAPQQLMAWMGPAIGPTAFQVGAEVRSGFVSKNPDDECGFTPDGERFKADIFCLARQRLLRAGVTEIRGGGLCTYSDAERWYSFRRNSVTGRFATAIWRD